MARTLFFFSICDIDFHRVNYMLIIDQNNLQHQEGKRAPRIQKLKTWLGINDRWRQNQTLMCISVSPPSLSHTQTSIVSLISKQYLHIILLWTNRISIQRWLNTDFFLCFTSEKNIFIIIIGKITDFKTKRCHQKRLSFFRWNKTLYIKLSAVTKVDYFDIFHGSSRRCAALRPRK